MKRKLMLALCLLSVAGYTTNVYAEELTDDNGPDLTLPDDTIDVGDIVYEEDIPVGHEDEYEYVGDETKEEVYKDLTEEEANTLKVTIELDGYTTAILHKYTILVETKEEVISEKEFEKEQDALDYISSLEEEGYIVENIVYVHNNKEGIFDETKIYNTIDEIKKALEDFFDEFNIDPVGGEEITDIKTTEELEDVSINTPFENEEDANKALADILDPNNETREYYYDGKVSKLTEIPGEFIESEINEEVSSIDEMNDIISNIESKGYIIDEEPVFIADTVEEDRSLPTDKLYDNESEAQNAIDEFANKYNNVIPGTPEKVENSSKNEVVLELTEIEKAAKYDKESDANDFINTKRLSIEGYNTTDFEDTLKVNTDSSELGEANPIDKTGFKNSDEALTYLNNLEGFDVVKDKEIVIFEAGTAKEAVRITSNNIYYKITDTVFFLLKKGNNYVAWTLNEISSENQANFIKGIEEIEKSGTSLGMNLNALEFKFGYNQFTAQDGKPFNIYTDENGDVWANVPSNAGSYVSTGTYTPVYEIHAIANGYNYIEKFAVSGQIIKKGYSWKASATGTETVKLASGKVVGKKKIAKKGYYVTAKKYNKKHTANASGKKQLDSVKLSLNAKKDIMAELYSIDTVKKQYEYLGGKGKDEEPSENPKTGDNGLWVFTFGAFSMIGAAACANSLRKKEE